MIKIESNNIIFMEKLYVTIMAGGMGKRMQSDLPKVLHKVKGEAMIVRLLKEVNYINPDKILIIVGKYKNIIKEEIDKHFTSEKIIYVNQPVALGTGDAVKCTLEYLEDNNITNIILNGDVPMLKHNTIQTILDHYRVSQSNMLITSIHLQNPAGCGRILLDSNNNFNEIVEEKDCNPTQKLITMVNVGIYICNSGILKELIPQISSNNSQSEYYVTDLVKLYKNNFSNGKLELHVLPTEKEIEIYNINTREQLLYIENI